MEGGAEDPEVDYLGTHPGVLALLVAISSDGADLSPKALIPAAAPVVQDSSLSFRGGSETA